MNEQQLQAVQSASLDYYERTENYSQGSAEHLLSALLAEIALQLQRLNAHLEKQSRIGPSEVK